MKQKKTEEEKDLFNPLTEEKPWNPTPDYDSEEPDYDSEEPDYDSEEPDYDSEEFDYDSEEPDYDSEEFLRKDALDDFSCVKTRSGV